MYKQFIISLFISCFAIFQLQAAELTLEKGKFRIVVPKNTDEQVMLAAKTLAKDIQKVMGFTPTIGSSTGKGVELCIVQDDKKGATSLLTLKKELDDFESHRIYADPASKRIYLYGKDMRGTIYAIYTFSEKILGVPPLWYWCSWEPEHKESIVVDGDLDLYFRSPSVRYRSWFPNDTDLFVPWLDKTKEHWDAWLETILRMKFNCVELEGCVRWDKKMLTDDAMRLQHFGLVLTSHHHAPLACGFVMWDDYWTKVRGMKEVPRLTLKDKQSIYDFWQYSIDCVKAANIEYIWLIGFRGSGDHAFWERGDEGRYVEDSPTEENERAAVANEMTQKMYDMICETTGEDNPFVRMTFYNELSNLMGKGLLTPPNKSNMLWTYVAARRDHYPSIDLRRHTNNKVKVGLYFNFQFTSTGSHLAPAEGPWKMEYNFRYALSKAPLQFSVVNMGNTREHLMEAAANSAFLWNFNQYNTDEFLLDYAKQYFGEEHAKEVAQLYYDFYHSYWNQCPSDFQNMPRQFVFQDLRYKDAYSDVSRNFGNGKINIFDDSRLKFGDHQNELNDLVAGMAASAKGFTDVLDRAEALREKLEPRYRQFFNDNFIQYARFMAGISRGLYHFAYASLHADDDRAGHGALAMVSYTDGARALFHAQHDEFAHWIDDAKGSKFGLGYVYSRMTDVLNMNDCKLTQGKQTGAVAQFTTTQASAGMKDILIVCPPSEEGRWLTIKAGNRTIRKFAPKAGAVKAISDPRSYVIATAYLPEGKSIIEISDASGKPIAIEGIHVTSAAYPEQEERNHVAITSPDGKNTLTILTKDEGNGRFAFYKVTREGKEIISSSKLGLLTSMADFTQDITVGRDIKENTINESYSMPSGKRAQVVNHYNEAIVPVRKNGMTMNIVFRVYNDGIAYRYEFPGSTNIGVEADASEMNIPSYTCSWGQRWTEDYSQGYPKRDWQDAQKVEGGKFAQPVLIETSLGEECNLLLSEATVDGTFCRSYLVPGKTNGSFTFHLGEKSPVITDNNKTPWRMAFIGSLKTIATSDLIDNLNDPSVIKDMSWIQAGLSSWDWGGNEGGIPKNVSDFDLQKKYIDFAAEMGWPYFTLDEGWSSCSYDRCELVRYAAERGVKVIIWQRQALIENDEQVIRNILKEWKDEGFVGVKIDFFKGDSREQMLKQERILKIAADLQMVVNYHGCTTPTGLRRKYPNFLTAEAVDGNEDYFTGGWNKTGTDADYNATLVFTRNAVGPMDYTPFEFGTRDGDRHRDNTTWAHQLATGVTFESGIQTVADSPNHILNKPYTQLLKDMPASWDDSWCLEAAINQYVTMLRRKGSDFFLGSTSQEARTLTLALDFLEEGVKYEAHIYRDGKVFDEVVYKKKKVKKGDTLSVNIAKTGGCVVHFKKK